MIQCEYNYPLIDYSEIKFTLNDGTKIIGTVRKGIYGYWVSFVNYHINTCKLFNFNIPKIDKKLGYSTYGVWPYTKSISDLETILNMYCIVNGDTISLPETIKASTPSCVKLPIVSVKHKKSTNFNFKL